MRRLLYDTEQPGRPDDLDDDELQQRIAERIDSDAVFWTSRGRPRAAKTQIEVRVEDGYATLTGTARTPSERRRADLLARALGARGVDNRLQVHADADTKAS